MSFDSPDPHDSPDAAGPPEKQGTSAGSKVLLILGIIFVILVVLCCGGLIAAYFWANSYFGEAMSEDPQVVRQLTDEIVSIDVPEQLQPAFSMDMQIPFTGQEMMKWVAYADESNSSVLVMASFGEAFAGQNKQQMHTQIRQALRGQGLGQPENVNITERTEREIEVRGQPVTFSFGEGQQENTDRQWIEVTGTLEGPEGRTVMLIVSADKATLSEEQIVDMIKSIE